MISIDTDRPEVESKTVICFLVEHHLIGRNSGDMISESVGLDNLNQICFSWFLIILLWIDFSDLFLHSDNVSYVPSKIEIFAKFLILSTKINAINSVHSTKNRKHPNIHVSYTDSGINSAQFCWNSNILACLESLKRMPIKGQCIKRIWIDFGLPNFISLQKWGS